MPAAWARRVASKRSQAELLLESYASQQPPWHNMGDLTTLPNQLDPKTRLCRAIIETPKGCRNKFDYDPDSNLFELGGLGEQLDAVKLHRRCCHVGNRQYAPGADDIGLQIDPTRWQ